MSICFVKCRCLFDESDIETAQYAGEVVSERTYLLVEVMYHYRHCMMSHAVHCELI